MKTNDPEKFPQMPQESTNKILQTGWYRVNCNLALVPMPICFKITVSLYACVYARSFVGHKGYEIVFQVFSRFSFGFSDKLKEA